MGVADLGRGIALIAVDRKRQAWAPIDYFPGRTALVAELRRDPQ